MTTRLIHHRRCRQTLTTLIAMMASFICVSSFAAGDLSPNETLVLRSAEALNPPDAVSEDCFNFRAPIINCQSDASGEQIGGRTFSRRPFARLRSTSTIAYDFKIDDEDGDYDTVLNAQVAGRGQFNGFAALVAGGEARGTLDVRLLDLGAFEDVGLVEPQVVAQRSLASHVLRGKVTTGVDFSIHVEGGAPYVGVGGSPGLKFNVQLQKTVVRDTVNFGIQALLKRGHKYRVEFAVVVQSKVGAIGGTSIAQFQSGGPVTDILGIENWLDPVEDTLSAVLPDLKAESMRIKQGLTWFQKRRMQEPEIETSAGDFVPLTGTRQLLRTKAQAAGLPISFREIVEKRFRQRIPDAVEEGFDRPGFTLDELSVTLEPDPLELAGEQEARQNEILRLLLLPHGQRESDFVDCDSPGNSGGNGNANSGCQFPGNTSSSNNTQSSQGGGGTGQKAAVASVAGASGGGGSASWLLSALLLTCIGFRRGQQA